MAENFIANIKSKLGELRKEYLPSQKETKEKEEKERQEKEKRLAAIQEKMRLDEERKVRDEEERKRQEEEKKMQAEEKRIKREENRRIKEEKKIQKEEEQKKLILKNRELSPSDLMRLNLPKKIKVAILTKYHRFTKQEAEGLSSVSRMYFQSEPEEVYSSGLTTNNKLIILTKVYKVKGDKKHDGIIKKLIKDLKILKQKELFKERLSKLKEDYNCLIQQKKGVPEEKHERKYALTDKLNKLCLQKKNIPSFGIQKQIIERQIEEVQAEIRKLPIQFIRLQEELSEKIKIVERKIEELNNELSSVKLMTDKEIKNKLLKEEKNRLRVDRLRDEVRKNIFEKEFQAIPEDDKIRFISDEAKEFVWRRDQAKCVKCGSQDSLEFDHIIPFSKGGSNTARNIQLLCEKCNRSKHDDI